MPAAGESVICVCLFKFNFITIIETGITYYFGSLGFAVVGGRCGGFQRVEIATGELRVGTGKFFWPISNRGFSPKTKRRFTQAEMDVPELMHEVQKTLDKNKNDDILSV